jgi:phosphoserine phosphatase
MSLHHPSFSFLPSSFTLTFVFPFRELIALLQCNGTSVYLVSGGFRRFIEPLAEILNIPRENVYANSIIFNEKGTNPRTLGGEAVL